MVDDDLKYAKEALTQPEYSAWSDDRLFYTHGLTFSVHRDSDVLGRSNWEVIKDDMLERFPDDCYVVGATHWAVGWCDQLAVRILSDERAEELSAEKYTTHWHSDIEEDDISEAFLAAIEWVDALASYPVADEMHFSEMETQESLKSIELEWPSIADEYTDEKAMEIHLWLHHNGTYFEAPEYWVPMSEIELACWNLGYIDSDADQEELEEWMEAHPQEAQKLANWVHELNHINHERMF